MPGTKLTPQEEAQFQNDIRNGEGYRQWYEQFKQKNGGAPNIEDPDYDYRAAWKAGIRPAPYEHDNGAYHWASSTGEGQMLKSENHPTAWMEQFMQQTGKDPNDVGVKSPEEAKAYLAGPQVHIGDAKILDPWTMDIGQAEVQDPWQVDMGPIDMAPQESEVVNPWDMYGIGMGEADIEGDGSFYLPRDTMSDPLQQVTIGPAEIKDPWSVK